MEIDQAFGLVGGDSSVGRYQSTSFLFIAACQILLAFQMCMMVVLTPLLTTQDGWTMTKKETSEASSIFMFGVMFGNIMIGVISDKKGRKVAYFLLIPIIIGLQGNVKMWLIVLI